MIRRNLPLFLAFSALACDDTTIRAGEPLAQVEGEPACAPATPQACVDFGLVEAGKSTKAELHFGSATQTAVTLTGVRVEGADAAVFKVGSIDLPATVAGGNTLDLEVSFAPTWTPGDAAHPWTEPRELYRGTVVLLTDDPKRPEVKADLVGRASIAAAKLDPAAVDFGGVPVGGLRRVERLVLSNEGDVPLLLPTNPFFDEASAAAGFGAASSLNVTKVDPHQKVALDVGFIPAGEGPAQGALIIDSNDPRGRVQVALKGEGVRNTPPTVCLGLVRVFDRFGRERPRSSVGTYALEPHDRAIVTARPETDAAANSTCAGDSRDPEGDPVTFRWEPLDAPQGSRGALQPFSALHPLAAWQRELLVDVEGDYTTEVVVTENNGVGLSARAAALWHVAPRGLSVTLSWDAADGSTLGTDLDLHLVRPAWTGESHPEPRLCTGSNGPDCYWATCRLTVSGTSPLDWGATGADNGADPSQEALANDPLLAADSTGEAPLVEQLSIPGPAAGDYALSLHFFEDSRPGRPGQVPFRLTLGLADQPPRVIEGVLPQQGALYHVGTVRWSAGGAAPLLDSTRAGLGTLAQCR